MRIIHWNKYVAHILLIILVPLLFQNCGPKRPHYVDEKIKSFGLFSTGSYWVYYCDSLKLYDSISANGKSKGFISCFRSSDCEDGYEYIKIYLRSSLYPKNNIIDVLYLDQIQYCSSYERQIDGIGFEFKFRTSSIDNKEIDNHTYFPNNENYDMPNDTITYKSLKVYDSEIDNKQYKNYDYFIIVESIIERDSTNAKVYYYLSPEVGVIRKEYHYKKNVINWDLVRYKIIK